MSEELNPEVVNAAKDVAEITEEANVPSVNYAELTLGELSQMFEGLMADEERMKRAKEAENIKTAFYKKLTKEKAEIKPADTEEEAAEASNIFESIENGFKTLYANFKKERAEYSRKQEEERGANLVAKQAVIEDLKALVDKQEDVTATFPEFRAIQARWREIGPVPASAFRDLNDTYQFYVEKFYDKVQINRDMRDLDFRKNLEAKQGFCEEAERLAEDENVIDAFKELQKLHEQWKEYGPVAKEFRDSIWDRFKAATAKINKNYQAYFEGQKEQHEENLQAKIALCEKVEAIVAKEEIGSSEWSTLTKEIEDIQKEWKTIGYASKKENQKVYARFRAANDKFFERKRVFYAEYKDGMSVNAERKLAIVEKAEALKDSTEWKKTTDALIQLQKEWKEIGAVPRKKAEALWKRFRAACDEFFARKEENAKSESGFRENLRAKKALVEEIKAMEPSEDKALMKDLLQSYQEKWNAIGFVPFREKDAINKAYREALEEKFSELLGGNGRGSRQNSGKGAPKGQRTLSEKDKLIQQYNRLQQEAQTCENNIGFFAASKNSEPLIRQMQEKIEGYRAELKELEAKILKLEEGSNESEE
ncbi:MAG: DUF349 domain-containing protein [Bacteroidales bacterium]|nr:DUF349 domain-containing protein [Bacteroidales bacterium]